MGGWFLLAALLGVAACGGGQGRETLRGLAANAKGGAVVQTGEGRTLYVGGLESWPPELQGRTVEVTGRVRRRYLPPEALVSDAGEYRAGASGVQEIIEGASWRAAP